MYKRWTYQEVKEFVENNNCELLDKEYKNSYSKLKLRCACGKVFETNFHHFKDSNQRQCKECGIESSKNKQRLLYEEVRDFIEGEEGNGCELLSEEYVNNRTKLKLRCACGKIFETSFNSFKDKKQRQCRECSGNPILNFENVKEFIEGVEGNGCKLLSEKYVDNRTKLKLRCACGKIFETSFDSFKRQNTRQCRECGEAKKSGENHPNYNPNLTDEEREQMRKIPKYQKWKRDVYRRDNYVCQCCGEEGNLNVHHLNNYSWDKQHRTNKINGITLCRNCHDEFHSMYGYRDTTIIQFRDFIYKKYLQTKDIKYITILEDIDNRLILLIDNLILTQYKFV